MRFLTLQHCNGRTAGGHHFAQLDGIECEVPDDDEDMCALIRDFQSRGMVRIHRDVVPPAEDKTPAAHTRKTSGKSKED